jgi:hypothetical protein
MGLDHLQIACGSVVAVDVLAKLLDNWVLLRARPLLVILLEADDVEGIDEQVGLDVVIQG